MNQDFDFIILCDYETSQPLCGIRLFEHCPRKLRRVFDRSNLVNSMLWHEVEDTDRAEKVGARYVDLIIGTQRIRVHVVLGSASHGMPTQQNGLDEALLPSDDDVSSVLEISTYAVTLALEVIDVD